MPTYLGFIFNGTLLKPFFLPYFYPATFRYDLEIQTYVTLKQREMEIKSRVIRRDMGQQVYESMSGPSGEQLRKFSPYKEHNYSYNGLLLDK